MKQTNNQINNKSAPKEAKNERTKQLKKLNIIKTNKETVKKSPNERN